MLLSDRKLTGESAESIPVLDARVIFLTHYIPLYQVRVLQSIAQRVRELHVLVSTEIEPNRHFEPDWTGLDVTVQDTWTLRRLWQHRPADDVGFVDPYYVHIPFDTSRRLKALKPDAVMSLELGARSLGATRFCQRHPETKSVLCTYMSEHTESCRGWIRRRLRRRLLNQADAVTYNGPSCKRYLLNQGVADDRLYHFPYAADDRTTYKGPVERDDQQTRNKLLCVGQLSERKGVLPLLQSLSEYCRSRPNRLVEMSFAGTGQLQDKVASFGTPDNLHVKMLGNVPPEDLAVHMLRSGALIAPTLADEWMLVVNEALHAGLPVIGSIYAQAVETLIQDDCNGWTYDPSTPGSLHKTLDAYFGASADAIAAMRVNSRRTVAHRTPEWAAEGAINALRYVLGVDKHVDATAE